MNEKLYDVIVGGNYFTHSIGKIYDSDILFKLESVFKLQGLFSKDSLRKMGIFVSGIVQGNIRITKDCYVSLFDPAGANIEKRLKSASLSTYFPVSNEDIIFLVDNSIELIEGAKRSEFDWHEIIVKNKVPIDYIFGIVVPDIEQFREILQTLLNQYDHELLIYDFEGNLLKLKNYR